MKPAWQSKTVITNVVVALASLYPPATAWIQSHPEIFTFGWMAINLVLRSITKGKVSIL